MLQNISSHFINNQTLFGAYSFD